MGTNHLAKNYNEKDFWAKIHKLGKKLGAKVLRPALKLYFAARSPDCPAWAKATIYGALAYFVMPIDLVPDFLMPLPIGYTDDISVMLAAIASISMHIGEKERDLAEAKLKAMGLG
jgi:uncharacterized membrane protein YkvA (DUF1232 family)